MSPSLSSEEACQTDSSQIRYVWTQKPSTGRTMFFFVSFRQRVLKHDSSSSSHNQIRYYTIMLLIFDVVQIHSFAIKGVPSKRLCVIIDPIVRIVGAISLWAVEIVMQLRIYAMYDCSKKVHTTCHSFLSSEINPEFARLHGSTGYFSYSLSSFSSCLWA